MRQNDSTQLGRATALEEYLAREHSEQHPLEFFVRLRYRGRFDIEALQKAARATMDRHPLSRSRLEWRRRRAWWAGGEREPIEIAKPGSKVEWRPLDLSQRSGVRLVLQQDFEERRGSLIIQVHHCVTDGRGGLQLLEDLLSSYAEQATGSRVRLRPLEPTLLAGRGAFGLTPRRSLSLFPIQLLGLIGIRRAFFRRVLCMGTVRRDAGPAPLPAEYPTVLVGELTGEQSRRYRNVARLRRVSDNDLIVRDVYLALHEVLAPHPDDRRWIRLALPFDLRTPEQRRMPAANVFSMVLLDRRMPLVGELGKLLYNVSGELSFIKRHRLALTLVGVLNLAQRFPLLWKVVHRQAATALLTNIGVLRPPRALRGDDDQFQIGGLVVERVETVAPIRRDCPVALCLYQYARCLHVSLHYDPREIDADKARELHDAVLRRLQATAAQPGAAGEASPP